MELYRVSSEDSIYGCERGSSVSLLMPSLSLDLSNRRQCWRESVVFLQQELRQQLRK